MRLLKSLIDSFVDTFLVLYFLEVSNDNIIALGSYQLIYVVVVYLIIYSCRNFAKTRHRITLMRIAMILDILFFVSIMILKGEIANYAYFVGLLRGLEEGFYYSVFIATSAIATIITLFVMILNCNAITIIVFNFCQTVYKRVAHVINEANGGNLCNSPKIRRNYKMEYWITTERYYVSGRIVSILLFILTAFTPDTIPIMLIFSLALAAFAFSSLQLQRAIAKKGSSPKSPSRHAYAFRRIDSSD